MRKQQSKALFHAISTVTATLALSLSLSASAQGELDEDTAAKITAAMEAGNRPEADRERDRNRKPLETLGFFGFADDLTVLELVPGGGWYTRLLMPTLADEGKLYMALGTGRAAQMTDVPGFDEAEILDVAGFGARGANGRFDVEPFSLGVDDIDLALTFRNMHNFSESGRANINKAVFEGLKSGGHYGVVDHTQRHMQEGVAELRRRMDPVLIIKEVEAAGFEFVDYTDLHAKPDDNLQYDVGRATVRGNSDRFTLLFRKP